VADIPTDALTLTSNINILATPAMPMLLNSIPVVTLDLNYKNLVATDVASRILDVVTSNIHFGCFQVIDVSFHSGVSFSTSSSQTI
jgi:hypothetical protein